MVAAIDGENDASIRFHERLGFVEVARLPELGRWLDLVLVQLRLDDRAVPPEGLSPAPSGWSSGRRPYARRMTARTP